MILEAGESRDLKLSPREANGDRSHFELGLSLELNQNHPESQDCWQELTPLGFLGDTAKFKLGNIRSHQRKR